jgi:hypothetical protein
VKSLARPLLCGLALAVMAVGSVRAVDYNDPMTPEMQASVDRGLAYLAQKQRPSGSFSVSSGGYVGVVAACALAFMAYGHVPGSGQYGPVTGKALQFLLDNAQPDGLLYREGAGPSPMYHHGLACLALAEAWGQTGDRRIRDAVRKGADLIVATQNRQGGWRYQPKIADADLSATVMQLMALRAAKDAGLEVPKETIDAGIEYVKKCHNAKGAGKDGGFAYTPNGGSGWARTGAGITSLQVAGNYKATEVLEGIEYLLQFKPVTERKFDDEQWFYYGGYYATMGMYQGQSLGSFGRKAWDQWFPAITRELLSRQKADGSWDGNSNPYPTAMALLMLALPYRYLPIYQR